MDQPEQFSSPITALDLVDEAVQETRRRLLLPGLPILDIYRDDPDMEEKILAKATEEACGDACIYMLYHLLSKGGSNFKNMFLVELEETDIPFKSPNWKKHFYVLLQTSGNQWVSTSPANYSGAKERKVFDSPDLDEVLDAIQTSDGGRGPTVDFVQTLVQTGYKPPSIIPGKIPSVETTVITVGNKGQKAEQSTIKVILG